MQKIMTTILAVIPTLVISGCESDDERLARFAEQSVSQQAQQNRDVAAQHKEVARTARALVEADTKSRADFGRFASELHAERQEIASQRHALESERVQLATQRIREPVIAGAIQTLGILVVCALPLVVALYVLRAVSSNAADEAALSELLVGEIVQSESPLLLGRQSETHLLDAD